MAWNETFETEYTFYIYPDSKGDLVDMSYQLSPGIMLARPMVDNIVCKSHLFF